MEHVRLVCKELNIYVININNNIFILESLPMDKFKWDDDVEKYEDIEYISNLSDDGEQGMLLEVTLGKIFQAKLL